MESWRPAMSALATVRPGIINTAIMHNSPSVVVTLRRAAKVAGTLTLSALHSAGPAAANILLAVERNWAVAPIAPEVYVMYCVVAASLPSGRLVALGDFRQHR